MRRQLPLIKCAWCKREFAPTRIDAKYCCRTCLERHFIDERRRALAAYRAMQRQQRTSLFFTGSQLVDDEADEHNTIRRRA
jgi:hypothetical protein